MTTTRTQPKTSPAGWILAVVATCVFVFGMLPSAVMAACTPETNHSCCCSSSQDNAEAETSGCDANGCDCQVRPDHAVPDVDTNATVSVDSVEVPEAPVEAALQREQRPQATLRVSAPRGDPPPAPSQPIYIQHRVLLI